MHANSEQLLAFGIGDLTDQGIRGHIEDCAACRQRLAEFSIVADQLCALPEEVPPPDLWKQVVAKADAASNKESFNTLWRISATGLAASLVLVLALNTINTEPVLETAQAVDELPNELEHLVNRSQVLESYLSQVQHGVAVTSVRTAGTIVELEDSIAYIDYRLNNARRLGITADERLKLWRYRNELMQSLVTVHYAQAKAKSI